MNRYGLQWAALQDYLAIEETTNSSSWGLGGTGKPPPNHIFIYAKDNGSGVSQLCYKNDNNQEVCFPVTGSSIPTGTGTANRMAYWSTASNLAANAALTTGRVPFADSNGLLTDIAALSWSNPTLTIDSATADPALIIKGRDAGTSSANIRLADDAVNNRFQIALAQGATFFSALSAKYDGIIRTLTDSANMIFLVQGSSPGSFKWSSGAGGADTEKMRLIGSSGDLLIGATAVPSGLQAGRGLFVIRNSGTIAETQVAGFGNTGQGAVLRFGISRGTVASPTASKTDDLADIALCAADSTSGINATSAALIRLALAEDWDSSHHGTDIRIFTTPLASITRAERFRIGPSGQLGIGGATYGTSGNIFKSGGSGAAPSWGTVNLLDSNSIGDTLTGTVVRGDLIIGNSTPKWSRLARGSSGAFVRNDGTDVAWSTLILPNSATANRIAYATSTNNWGESADLTFDGTDFLLGSGIRARMASQNRFRHLNSMAQATAGTQTTINSATWTSVALNGETFDTDTIHDTSTNNSRLTIKLTGKYIVWASADFSAAAGGSRYMKVYKNGTTDLYVILLPPPTAANNIGGSFACVVTVAATDYIELQMYQDSGGSLTNNNALNSIFGCAYIGE